MHIVIPEVTLKWQNTKKTTEKKSIFSVYRLVFGLFWANYASGLRINEFPLYGMDNYNKMGREKFNAAGFLPGRGISI